MKILQVLPALSAGGVERTAIEIAGALRDGGHVPHVACAGGRLEPELSAAGGILHRLPLETKNPIKMRRNTKALIKIIKDNTIDIVHARSRAPAWSAYAAAKACGVPYLATYHGIYNAKSGLKRRYNAIMARGEIVIANSQFTADHIVREHGLPPDTIRVIPRGVDMARFDPARVTNAAKAELLKSWNIEGERTVILLPGRLTSWKGQQVAIDSLPMKTRLNPVLVLLGDAQGRDDYVQSLWARAQALGYKDALRIPGHSADMPAAYAAADFVLSCSTDPEAFGRVAAEAQAMGRWVIASDHGGAKETVIDGVTGARVPPGDASALRAALEAGPSAAFTPECSRAHIAQNFSDTQMKAKTLAVYAELLAAPL